MGLPSIELASFTPANNLLYISQRDGPVKTLAKGFPDQRPGGYAMSADSGMDLEEELLPLVSRDALHEYSRWTSFVKFVTDGDEHLSASSDLSCFSPFRWENLLEEVSEQWCSLVDWIECHHGDVTGRHCHGGAKVGAPSTWSGSGHVGRSKPPSARLVLECVWLRSSRTWADGSWRSLMKTPSRGRTHLASNFVRKSAASLSFWGT